MKRACTAEQEMFGRTILDALSAPICVIDEVGTILFVNQSWRDCAVAKDIDLAVVTENSHYFRVCQVAHGPGGTEAQAFADGIQAVLREECDEFSLQYLSDSLTEQRWFIGKVTPLRQPGSLRAVIVHQQIIPANQPQIASAEHQELLEMVLNQAADAIVVCDVQGNQIFANIAACQLAHRNVNEKALTNTPFTWGKAYYPDGRSVPLEKWALVKALRGETTLGAEARMVRPDGSDYEVLLSATPLRNVQQDIIGAVATFSDITERKQMEEVLRSAHKEVKDILESISDAFVSLDRQWRYTYVNRTATRLLRRSREELSGRTLWEAFPAARGTDFEQGLRHAMEQQVFVIFEAYYKPLGTWFECHCYPSPEGLSVFFSDTTERKRIERALRENEERLRAIIEAVPDVLLVLGEDGHYMEILTADPHLLYTDPEALRGRSVTDVLPIEVAQQLLAAIRRALHSRQTQTIEYELPIPKAGKRCYEVCLAPLGGPILGKSAVVALARDVTRHRLTEANLRQAQKMEAIGQLTGGVAHDFNNLLAIIMGNLELLAEKLTDRIELRDFVQRPLEAAERGAALIQYLLTFSRRQRSQNSAVNTNALVAGMIEMLRRTLGETIEIKTIFVNDLARIVIDPSQLETALLNLALNARAAMPHGGELILETANVWLDEDYTAVHRYVQPGRYVLLTVSDTGVGMAPEVREHALEPFFTTKEVGQGSGLGLSMVYGLIKQSGGHIEIYSEINRGTTVELYLPATETTEVSALTEVSTQQQLPLPRGQAQLILVVEDNAFVRQSAVRMLQNLGYRVMQAASAKEALQVLEKTSHVAVLFTDVILPGGLSGVDLAKQARQRFPSLKVLFTSGYTEHNISSISRFPRGSEFLRKPYRQSQLAIRLHVMLADDSSAAP